MCTSVTEAVQRSFPNLSFLVCSYQAKNLQNNHFYKPPRSALHIQTSSSASALSKTFSNNPTLIVLPIHSIFAKLGENRICCTYPLRSTVLFGAAPTGAYSAGCLVATSREGDWVTGSGRGSKEESNLRSCPQQGHRLSMAGSGRGLKGGELHPAKPSPSQGRERPFHSFLPLTPASPWEGEKNKALAFSIISDPKRIQKHLKQKLLPFQPLKSFPLYCQPFNPSEVVGFSGVFFQHTRTH